MKVFRGYILELVWLCPSVHKILVHLQFSDIELKVCRYSDDVLKLCKAVFNHPLVQGLSPLNPLPDDKF